MSSTAYVKIHDWLDLDKQNRKYVTVSVWGDKKKMEIQINYSGVTLYRSKPRKKLADATWDKLIRFLTEQGSSLR